MKGGRTVEANMGKRIKELRIKKGMTQEELGNIIGVKKAAIQKYESGSVENLKRTSIAALSHALECSPTYLMGWEEEPKAFNSQDVTETKIKLIARKATDIPQEDMDELIKTFENTLDIYLKARNKQ